ncbi:GNAT family N-acetyltransferase [Microbacterium sp. No. 7]|uniref:GNAT family N-acetyltransferase n=1 Tax=Microbacterium sp. No. 7 TaxID=1714373 RepID=UPI0006CFFA56|nr:GNAT family N-acetyltransferase [Microbacterium sp. No. 7]ALJ19411.1 acetyltransferase [Microbacterium sp. No. 7]
MSGIRPFRAGDEPAIAEICVRTADDGGDATGLLDDDALWPAMFALPYAARHPDLAFVAEVDGRVVGYVVGTDDTRRFEEWFAAEWWPAAGTRWPRDGAGRQAELLAYADARGGAGPYADDHPAHLHIDLLPEAQGRGLGRRLIATFVDALRRRGVPGVHLVASAGNAAAALFYPRVGFAPLPAPDGDRAFGLRLHQRVP